MEVPTKLPKILGGDGLSPGTAVRFERCRVSERVAAEHEFISNLYGTEHVHWKRQLHMTTMNNQSLWWIVLDSQDVIQIYFEIGDTVYETSK